MPLYHLTPVSGNIKTGPIAGSTTSRDSCPVSCPFIGAGCYAENHGLIYHWLAVAHPAGASIEGSAKKGRGLDMETFSAQLRTLPKGSSFRHNQAGDLPHVDGMINGPALVPMLDAIRARKLRAFTYTHHTTDTGTHAGQANARIIARLTAAGLTVNASTETAQQADRLKAYAPTVPVVLTVTEEEAQQRGKCWTTPAGHAVVICPAQTVEGMNCAQCMLCHKADRKSIVGFIVHGTSKSKARKSIMLRTAEHTAAAAGG